MADELVKTPQPSYTGFMILHIAALALAVAAQAQPAQKGVSHHVFLKNAREDFYAFIEYEGRNREGKDIVRFRYDQPGREGTVTYPRAEIFDMIEETPDERKARYEGQLEENRVNTAVGWIDKEEYRRAERAIAMAKELEQRLAPPEPPQDAAPIPNDTAPGEKPEAPGFAGLWGPQAALALGALVLIGIIAKLVIFGEEE